MTSCQNQALNKALKWGFWLWQPGSGHQCQRSAEFRTSEGPRHSADLAMEVLKPLLAMEGPFEEW